MSDELRRNMALFPIGIVTKLTQLSARQIRYYEQHQLIRPERNSGKQRLFSFNDVERLLEIKALIDQGLNIAGIKQVLKMKEPMEENVTVPNEQLNELSDKALHQLLRSQIFSDSVKPNNPSLIQGQLSRFFH